MSHPIERTSFVGIKNIEEENNSKLTFELSDLTYNELLITYKEVSDFIDYAKRNKIPVGPGRGSGAGSLVAFVGLRLPGRYRLRYNHH